MNTYNEGDRVTHPSHGDGTVVDPYDGTGWPTVLFDNGKKIMTHDSFLTPLPKTDTVLLKNGDIVRHPLHGFAKVLSYDPSANLVEIMPEGHGGLSSYVHPVSLMLAQPRTPEPKPEPKFKIGDRVSHPLHRDGTVDEIDEFSGFITVNLGGNRAYRAFPNQITLAVPEPTYHICIEEITGAAHVPGSLTAKEVANYIADKVDWRVAKEITITKEGN